MSNEGMVAVRLTQNELAALDQHAQGQLSRAQIVRILIQGFLELPDEKQRQYLVNHLFQSKKDTGKKK